MAQTYVKALYDFHTSETQEIPLLTGDVVRVLRKVDDNWLKGSLHGKIGNFPANFVQTVQLPAISTGQKIFAATRSFPAEVAGDLGFQKGIPLST